jgi:DNA polymerase-3 subunit gamma/tau
MSETELYKKHRPRTLAEVVGQPDAVRTIEAWGDRYPHAILLSGPSGCGKTTIARILRRQLGCNRRDFNEINCADFRGIDSVRDIRRRAAFHAIGKSMIWLIDECHKLTNDAQNALLKLLEDTPAHVYFVLATTDPGKLIKTIQNRCSPVRVRELSGNGMQELIRRVAGNENFHPTDEVVDAIINAAEGSARKALVLLNSVIGISDPDQQRDAIVKSDTKNEAIEIARALMDTRTRWPDLQKILKGADIEDPEPIRRLVLGYCSTVLLNSGKPRAAMIIDYFQKPWYDCGKPGLLLACYEILRGK